MNIRMLTRRSSRYLFEISQHDGGSDCEIIIIDLIFNSELVRLYAWTNQFMKSRISEYSQTQSIVSYDGGFENA
jgi:hypothetical protein